MSATPALKPAGLTGTASSRSGLPRWFRHALRTILHLSSDSIAIVLAFRAAYELRFHWAWLVKHFPLTGADPGWDLHVRILPAIVPLWLGLFWYSARLYTRTFIPTSDRILQILKGAFLGTFATLAATYIYDRLEYSRLMMLLAGPLAAANVSLAHLIVLRIDAWLSRFEFTAPLLIVGSGKVCQLIRENVRARHPGVEIYALKELLRPSELAVFAAERGIREVILVRDHLDHTRLLDLAETCESSGLIFKMIPDLLELRLGEIQMDDSLGLPAYRLQHTSLTRANFLAKRTFDVAFSLVILALTAIPFALIALLITLESKGPALYKQKRIGFKGRLFEAYKFRTMVHNAEASLSAVRAQNDQRGGFFKAKRDPRVTRMGRALRRFSIDEFPQFINVLKGEMSVVGPRPLAVMTGEMEELLDRFGPTAKKRTNILPGITGLWQISGRSDISAEQRFALDMFYIEHWSLGLDLEIILKTIPAMLSTRGAY